MDRRTLISVLAGGSLAINAGCLGQSSGSDTDTKFELVDPELEVEDQPEVSVNDNTVTARGTVKYSSSNCGTVKLAHAEHERSQARLDLIIVATDKSEDVQNCNQDLRWTGYRAKTTVEGRLRRITVTEHHAFGETYSTTKEI